MTTDTRKVDGIARPDRFGGRLDPEPAFPGTYGLRPDGFRLPEGTRPGPVRLQVADLERSLAFYEQVLGLRRLEREGPRALLGTGPAQPPGAAGAAAAASPVLVELRERRGARPAPRRGRTGLYHFALLLPDRAALGRFVRHAAELGLPLGAGDHLVSESLYLHDPDDLGIEIYIDRPRRAWQRIGHELVMATDPLDLTGLAEAGPGEPWTGMPTGTVIGHLHLHVGDLATASTFYSGTVGFDQTVWSYPGALFLAADGYHHHLGTNVWAGPGASPPLDDEAQLLEWTVELPDAASLAAVSESLVRGGYEVNRPPTGGEADVVTRDPWGTRLRLSRFSPEASRSGREGPTAEDPR
ncbi:MAG TPA: VOC family protein [Thermoanaerobaculia bacterium]|nr:VOC family protein [Thermoanaerobaculia bacterium]